MNLDRNSIHQKLHVILSLCIAFFLPIARLVPIFIALMLLNWLVEGNFKNKFQAIIRNKYALLFIAFYLVHLVGLTYTNNINSGSFDLQVKFSLIVFPLILSSKPFSVKEKTNIFYALIAGCIASMIIMFARATYLYFSIGENDFFYENLSSYLIHPSYFSMYLNFAIAWLTINVSLNNFEGKRFSNGIAVLIIVLFSGMILMLSSKLGIITMVLLYVGLIIYYIIHKRKYIIGLVGLGIIAISIFVVMNYVPAISDRINRALDAVTNANPNETEVESTAVRLLVWKAATQVISDNLIIGTGTGDAKDELMAEYKSRGMTGALAHELNAHNEFLQVFVSLGIIGFVLLLGNLYFPLFFAFKEGNIIFLLFLLIVSLNFLTESMFETQAGVMFYAFFNSLLCFHKSRKSNS